MSSTESIATPARPTSPAARGSSESRPSCVGRSNADGQARLPAARAGAEAGVRLLGRREAGVLAHRPRTRPVAVGASAAGEREARRAARRGLVRPAVGGDHGHRDSGVGATVARHQGSVVDAGRLAVDEASVSPRHVIRVRVRLFAMLRERAGARRRAWNSPRDRPPATSGQPRHRRGAARPRLAVNRAYADRGTRLADGDEVAFIPPVSGGAIAAVRRAHRATRSTWPGSSPSSPVPAPARSRRSPAPCATVARPRRRQLDYEMYPRDGERGARADRVGGGGAARPPRDRRRAPRGRCEIGETTVAIACSAPHRAPALAACAETIDN